MSSPDRLRSLLTHPRLPLIAALVAVLLCLPALWAGLVGDDYVHKAVFQDIGALASDESPLLLMFRFMPGGEANAHLIQQGFFPWWANFDVQAAFLRPVSALTHAVDYALWPEQPWLQHLHSLAWVALVVVLVGLWARRTLRGSGLAVAGLTALLFAVEDAHAVPAGWLANRNALVAMAPGLVALLLHQRGRKEGRPLLQVLAPLALLVGLFAGESAIGATAFLLSWELFRGPGSLRRRVAALVPHGAVVVGWRLIYEHLGYGARGSGLYIDPGHEPLVFAQALVERLPVLALAQWGQLPVDLYLLMSRSWQLGLAAAGAGVLVAVGALLMPTLRRRRDARMLALAFALSLVPLCAAFPMDRLLMWPGVAALGLLAVAAGDAGLLGEEPGADGDGEGHGEGHGEAVAAPGPWRRRGVGLLLLLHGPLAALLLLGRTATLPVLGGLFSAGARTAPADARVPDQSFIFLNGVEILVIYAGIIRTVEGDLPAPAHMAQLGSLRLRNRITVRDPSTLVYRVEGGFLAHPSDNMFRHPSSRFRVGDEVHMRHFIATVEEITDDGRPVQVSFDFDAPLDDARWRWLAWIDGELKEVDLPEPGGRLVLPPSLMRPALPEAWGG